MRFCKFCDNMLYADITTEKDLKFYCKNCQNEEILKKEDNSICIIDDNKLTDDVKYKQYVNKYIGFDKTLPRVNNIECPWYSEGKCNKPDDKDNEVIYIKYDFINMKYMYHCCYCKNFWRT